MFHRRFPVGVAFTSEHFIAPDFSKSHKGADGCCDSVRHALNNVLKIKEKLKLLSNNLVAHRALSKQS